jgi:CheY-like chemotaxis protein
MPRVDGYELLRRVRRLDDVPRARSIPAIALTAFASAEDAARAMDAGYLAHLAKPVEPARLYAAIATLLSQRSRTPRAGTPELPLNSAF